MKRVAEKQPSVGAAPKRTTKTVEQLYQQKTHVEHILDRPDTYIGSVGRVTKEALWLFNADAQRFVCAENAEMVPGLFKVFDEVLNNATDAMTRDKRGGATALKKLKVNIDQKSGAFVVTNTGTIHLVVHKETKLHVPEMLFGSLLTSTNYDDCEERATIGRNGLGVKLTNIFSTQFTVKCRTNNRVFTQRFSKNMTVRKPASIVKAKGDAKLPNMVAVHFVPDWTHLDRGADASVLGDACQFSDTMLGMFYKRVIDLAAWNKGWQVWLNGKQLVFDDFDAYARLYVTPTNKQPVMTRELPGKQWRIGVTLSEQATFQHQSYVNHGETSRGGTHLDRIVTQIVKHVITKVKQQQKQLKTTYAAERFVKDQLFVFVYSQLDKPSFDTQSKEQLTKRLDAKELKQSQLPKAFLDELCATFPLVEQTVQQTQLKERQRVARNTRGFKLSSISVDKLVDARRAGTRRSHECRLFLTEGDSAKTMAMSGFDVIGSESNGVFPLKGKLLNVRGASTKKLMANAEVRNICKIIGLNMDLKYDTDAEIKKLRYGAVCVMADQDKDGFHICGLILNFLHHFWPALFKREGFVQRFITPIVKVSKRDELDLIFFNESAYASWLSRSVANNPKQYGYTVKYYKGLGTSTSAEAKSYFRDLNRHLINYRHDDTSFDVATVVEQAFGDETNTRKRWIREFWDVLRDEHLNRSGEEITEQQNTYRYFFEDELVQYYAEATERAIPSMIDGLKPSQRKVLWACFKRSLTKEVKVAQLAGYISEHAAYHHGEKSLNDTIVKMAQNYCGSNNVNLLAPNGQFGTRIDGGKDAASSRYIFTQLSPWTRAMFSQADEAVLTALEDDGQRVEPQFFVPVIPMVCCNGANGVGAGWSTQLPLYNPLDVIEQCRRICRNMSVVPLVPWYRGFKGTVTADPDNAQRFNVRGCFELNEEKQHMIITELPVSTWYGKYQERLTRWCTQSKPAPLFDRLLEHHISDTRVRFVLDFNDEQWAHAKEKGFAELLGLVSHVDTGNCHLFDEHGVLQSYADGPLDILPAFGKVRLDYYERRRQQMLTACERQTRRAQNKQAFIEATIAKDIDLAGKPKSEWIRTCRANRWNLLSEYEPKDDGCHYLIQLPMSSLTEERCQQLAREVDRLCATMDELSTTTPRKMWLNDLDECEKALKAL
jgi:DNA topoisomerase-2